MRTNFFLPFILLPFKVRFRFRQQSVVEHNRNVLDLLHAIKEDNNATEKKNSFFLLFFFPLNLNDDASLDECGCAL